MKNVIRYYSVLIFPILLGSIIPLFSLERFDSRVTALALWGVFCTFAILSPMIRLSKNKPWYCRFLCGIIGLVLVYAFTISIPFAIAVSVENGIPFIIHKFSDFMGMICVFSLFIYIPFMPYNIVVILCFLLLDVYSKKIEKLLKLTIEQ